MNHTERIAETARRHRHLTRCMAKQTIETYLELLAEEIAEGEWVDLYGIGKIQVNVEAGSGTLLVSGKDGQRTTRQVKTRLRTKVRLAETFKKRCRL